MNINKAQQLKELANEVARELESASIGGAITFEECVAVLGNGWLCWIPENESNGNPRDWKTYEENYSEFVKSLAAYRKYGDPDYFTAIEKESK